MVAQSANVSAPQLSIKLVPTDEAGAITTQSRPTSGSLDGDVVNGHRGSLVMLVRNDIESILSDDYLESKLSNVDALPASETRPAAADRPLSASCGEKSVAVVQAEKNTSSGAGANSCTAAVKPLPIVPLQEANPRPVVTTCNRCNRNLQHMSNLPRVRCGHSDCGAVLNIPKLCTCHFCSFPFRLFENPEGQALVTCASCNRSAMYSWGVRI